MAERGPGEVVGAAAGATTPDAAAPLAADEAAPPAPAAAEVASAAPSAAAATLRRTEAALVLEVGVLVWLAYLWVSTPYIGSGRAFFYWSLAGLPILVATWARTRASPHFRGWMDGVAAGLIALWVLLVAPAATGIGAELSLDGMILRREGIRLAGKALDRSLMVVPLAMCVAAIALVLELRHHAVRRVKGEGGGS